MRQNRRYSVARGTLVVVATRWMDRLIGLVSTVILARLLAPEDFGIIAMASVAIALADVMLDLGVNVALIRNRNATQAHYDTAWTIRLIQMSIATIVLVLTAPFAAEYFHDERVKPVLQVLAFSLLISGCENIGIVAFQKQMQFGAEFRFLFVRRIAGVSTTVIAAWLLHSYWALVIGALTGRAVGVVLSYWVHPMRPRLSFEKFREIFSISQWVLIRSIGTYAQHNLPRILVGRWSTAATMGAYTLADEISAMPSTELLAPLNRVLYPAFSEVQDNPEQLKRLFLLAQGVQALLAMPATVGLALVADEAVRIILGEKWLIAVPFIQVLALVGIAQALSSSCGYVLTILGKIRNLVLLVWAQLLLFVTFAFLLLPEQDPLAIAWLRFLVAAVGILLAFWAVTMALPVLRFRDIFQCSMRPSIGVATMAALLTFLPFPPGIPVALLLIFKITLGALGYLVTILGVWWLAGRPNGAESYLLGKAHAVLATHRANR